MQSASRDAYDPIETASIGELRALQLERLRLLEDLRLFPFTTKQHLRDNYPFGMFAVPREQVVRIHASSGRRVTPEP